MGDCVTSDGATMTSSSLQVAAWLLHFSRLNGSASLRIHSNDGTWQYSAYSLTDDWITIPYFFQSVINPWLTSPPSLVYIHSALFWLLW